MADNFRHKGLFDRNIENNSFVEEINSDSADFSDLEDTSYTEFCEPKKNRNDLKNEEQDDDIKLYTKLFPAYPSDSSVQQIRNQPKIEDVIILEKKIPALEKINIEETTASFDDIEEENNIEEIIINEQRDDNVDTVSYSQNGNSIVSCEIDDDFADFKFDTDETTKFYINQIKSEEKETAIQEKKEIIYEKKEHIYEKKEAPSIKEEVIELLRRFTGNDNN